VPLAVMRFRGLVPVRWEAFVLMEQVVTCDTAELPGSVIFVPGCAEMLRTVSEEPASYSLGNVSILS